LEIVTALILLPIEYNPDKKGKRRQISIEGFQDTAVEISDLFEKYGLGCTIDPYPKHGIWAKLGVIYEDINVILYCQENLLRRFDQEAILVKREEPRPQRKNLKIALSFLRQSNANNMMRFGQCLLKIIVPSLI